MMNTLYATMLNTLYSFQEKSQKRSRHRIKSAVQVLLRFT
mgnify:CR=1 FL=1